MYAHLDDSGNIVGSFAGPQPEGTPNYAIIDEDDARIAAYQDLLDALPLVAAAKAALIVSDRVATRCVKAGVTYPSAWQQYDAALRAIIVSGGGSMPARPAYPEGT